MHYYFNVPPCIICTPCIIWFRHGTTVPVESLNCERLENTLSQTKLQHVPCAISKLNAFLKNNAS